MVNQTKAERESTYLEKMTGLVRPDTGYTARGIGVRLFITCWLLYSMHFATNTIREIYLALAIGDHLSFRVDEYAHMHPDLYEKPGYGWHIGANPGGSMLAAIPYAISRPVIDRVVERVREQRVRSGNSAPPAYASPWPMAQKFYAESWQRGFDVKFGLAAFVMQAFCMAPISALAVVMMFFLLRRLLGSDKMAMWLALLYAFGTPVFFRTGYLSHNLILGHIAFFGFLAIWNPLEWRLSGTTRTFLAGLASGTAVLFDYSGLVLLGVLFVYLGLKTAAGGDWGNAVRRCVLFFFGSLGPICLLWFYQWQSFGHPFYPGQHWMPPVEWIDRGYQGFTLPQFDLLLALLLDYRFGLFVTAPLLLLGFLYPAIVKNKERLIAHPELYAILALATGLILFFSGVHYTRLQYNSGIRYLTPVFPFLFVPAALVLARFSKWALYGVSVVVITQNWCLAMHRDVERGLGILDPILTVFLGGFKLPALTTLSRMEAYREFFPNGVSPLPLFVLAAAILYGVWWKARRPVEGGL